MNNQLRVCSRCGKLHKTGYRCYANSRNYYKHNPELRKFRSSNAWKKKAEEIKERDKYLCQVCLSNNIFNYKDLSVHHIIPASVSEERRLDNSNLITVCERCHQDCEKGKIPKETQFKLVKQGD